MAKTKDTAETQTNEATATHTNDITALIERLDMLQDIVQEQADRIKALEARTESSIKVEEIGTTETPVIPSETFVFKGEKKAGKFKFTRATIFHEGQIIKASDALNDVELQALFVELYPTSVEKVG
jgi:hypothetical protein